MPHYTITPYSPDLEKHTLGNDSYFIATGPRAFENSHIISVTRHKTGIARVVLTRNKTSLIVVTRAEFLPPDYPIHTDM